MISKTIKNETGEERKSPHSYTHLSIDEFNSRLNKRGHITTIDHLGVNFPWFKGVSPVITDLREALKHKSAYFRFPTGEEWDFILPATKEEINSDVLNVSIERRPKFELVSFKKDSTPIIQIDCITSLTYEDLKELFPESIMSKELRNAWVYIDNKFGIDIYFVLNEPTNSEWSNFFEGHRLKT